MKMKSFSRSGPPAARRAQGEHHHSGQPAANIPHGDLVYTFSVTANDIKVEAVDTPSGLAVDSDDDHNTDAQQPALHEKSDFTRKVVKSPEKSNCLKSFHKLKCNE